MERIIQKFNRLARSDPEQPDKNRARTGRKSIRRRENNTRIEALQFEALMFSPDDARCSGEIHAMLATQGRPIGPYDVLIAGQALSRDSVLMTRNSREFERVHGLRLENWEEECRASD